MELLEYQAKELFKMVEIPILPSQTIQDSRQLKQLQIPYPVVLKSQVRPGGRGKAGGVRFAANTIDAIAAARTIFNLSILGEYPEVILAEAHYNAEREFFLAVVLDYDLQCPVLLGSAAGGMNVDSLLANLQQVVIEAEFSLFYARRLAAKMGLSGKLICSVSEIIAKMYHLLVEKDLDLIEINPLGVNTKGELMALDGKITLNDRGFARQPEIKALNFSTYQKQACQDNVLIQPDAVPVKWRWLNWENKTGKIATICNSFDLSLLTWDLLNEKRCSPACGILIENRFSAEPNELELYRAKLEQIIIELGNVKGLKAILLNIRATAAINDLILQTISSYRLAGAESDSNSQRKLEQKQAATASIQPEFILRLINEDSLEQPEAESAFLIRDLEAAVAKAIAIVKSN